MKEVRCDVALPADVDLALRQYMEARGLKSKRATISMLVREQMIRKGELKK
jgi:hypothetical protein